MVDGLEYFTKLDRAVNKLNKTIVTEIKIDENKIIKKVAEKMARGLSGRTTESIGI